MMVRMVYFVHDVSNEEGAFCVVPGTHKGPTYDHHENGYFCGAIDPDAIADELARAVPLMGPAGTLTIHKLM